MAVTRVASEVSVTYSERARAAELHRSVVFSAGTDRSNKSYSSYTSDGAEKAKCPCLQRRRREMPRKLSSEAVSRATPVRGGTRLKGVEKCRTGHLADRERSWSGWTCERGARSKSEE